MTKREHKCDTCNYILTEEDSANNAIYVVDNNTICHDCAKRDYGFCAGCGELIEDGAVTLCDGDTFCEQCAKEYKIFQCIWCEENYGAEDKSKIQKDTDLCVFCEDEYYEQNDI